MRDASVKSAIIFDLDGTLIDSCSVCVTILEAMIADRGSPVQIDPIGARYYMSHGGERMVSSLLAEACIDPAADLAEFRSRYLDIVTPTSALFDGVAEGLERLHAQGYRLAICSNKPQNLCEQVLIDTGIDHLFTTVVGGSPGVPPKPAPDLLEGTLYSLGLSADDCLFVGDSELDHAVAGHCDMPFHFVTYGYASPDWSPDNCHVHDDFPSLLTQLLPEQIHVKVLV